MVQLIQLPSDRLRTIVQPKKEKQPRTLSELSARVSISYTARVFAPKIKAAVSRTLYRQKDDCSGSLIAIAGSVRTIPTQHRSRMLDSIKYIHTIYA